VSRVARDDSGAVEVLADPAVPRGGCLIQSEFGAIDAGIASQIRELSHELLGVAPDDAGEEAETRGLVAGS
jgi:flagellar biosynthesis/type III secretory pathway protein FliH